MGRIRGASEATLDLMVLEATTKRSLVMAIPMWPWWSSSWMMQL